MSFVSVIFRNAVLLLVLENNPLSWQQTELFAHSYGILLANKSIENNPVSVLEGLFDDKRDHLWLHAP